MPIGLAIDSTLRKRQFGAYTPAGRVRDRGRALIFGTFLAYDVGRRKKRGGEEERRERERIHYGSPLLKSLLNYKTVGSYRSAVLGPAAVAPAIAAS